MASLAANGESLDQLVRTPSNESTVSISTSILDSRTESPGSTEFKFTSISDLKQRLATCTDNVITVSGISADGFTKLQSAREKNQIRKYRLNLYLADSKYLMITIPSSGHEYLHGSLDDKIYLETARMGLEDEFIPVHATEFPSHSVTGRVLSSGEGDSARKPKSSRPLPNDFPTLVIEAGISQTLHSLRQKARWWLDTSNGMVKIVILVRKSGLKTLHIEKWESVNVPATGEEVRATRTTRAMAAPRVMPECVQTIKITRASTVNDTDPLRFNPDSYEVTGGSLILSFVDLFLRSPILPEKDAEIDEAKLKKYAATFFELYST